MRHRDREPRHRRDRVPAVGARARLLQFETTGADIDFDGHADPLVAGIDDDARDLVRGAISSMLRP